MSMLFKKFKASDTAQAAILIEKNLHTKNYEILSDNNIRIFEYVDNPRNCKLLTG